MAWWRRSKIATTTVTLPVGDALTAAATNLRTGRDKITPRVENWQNELWGYYETLGEFGFAVDWRSDAISRVRLRAGKIQPGQDEPAVEESGPAVDLVAELGGGGASQLLGRLATLLDVPGEGYIVGEERGRGQSVWQVRSADEIRPAGTRVAIIDDDDTITGGRVKWRDLEDDSLVVRIWRPNRRFHYLADSRSRKALATMRELELVNRKIQAQYLSRLASAGIVIFPAELEFPVRPEFQDEPNPFVREWIETAREAIATPGTAASLIPIPIKVPGEFVDKVKFLDFTLTIDEQIIEKRESAIKRLATHVDIPPEVILGMADANHWGSWQIEEMAFKIHIAPTVELICGALTTGYLQPRLEAMGEDPDGWVVWYDASELTLRPDRSEKAGDARRLHEITGTAYRREIGFDEDDAPDEEEVTRQVLLDLTSDPQVAFQALAELIGEQPVAPAPAPDAGGGGDGSPTVNPPDARGRGMPGTRDQPPPPPDGDVLRRKVAAALQRATHNRRFVGAVLTDDPVHSVRLAWGHWTLQHPRSCAGALHTCDFTLAAVTHIGVAPGTPGVYACRLRDGALELGDRLLNGARS